MDAADVDLVGARLAGQQSLRLAADRRALVRVDDGLEAGGLELAGGVARDLAQGAVDLPEPAIELHERHADRRLLEGAAEALLGVLDGPLGPLAFADVVQQRVEGVAVVRAHRGDGELDGELAAVAMQRRELEPPAENPAVAGGQEVLEAPEVRRPVALGEDCLGEGAPDRLGARPAEDGLRLPVPIDDHAQVVGRDELLAPGVPGREHVLLLKLLDGLALLQALLHGLDHFFE